MHLYSELGSLQLNHSVANVDLSASTIIRFSSPSAALLSNSNTAPDGRLPLEIAKAAWIYRGQGLQMDINIYFQGLPLQDHLCTREYRNAISKAILESRACLFCDGRDQALLTPCDSFGSN